MFSVASRPRSWFPLLAIMAAAAGGLLAWLLIQRFENQTIQLKTSLTTEQVAIRLEDYLNTRLLIVEQMAELRERGQLLNEREFHRHAEGLMQDFPGLLAINWVDKEGIIQWVHPVDEIGRAHV